MCKTCYAESALVLYRLCWCPPVVIAPASPTLSFPLTLGSTAAIGAFQKGEQVHSLGLAHRIYTLSELAAATGLNIYDHLRLVGRSRC